MKKYFFCALLLGAVSACNNTSTTTDNTDSSKMANRMSGADTTNSTAVDKDATDFAVKAANGGMMEVELGQMAQQQAKSQRVKDFGAMLVADHTKANDELKSIAASKNITLPATVGGNERMHIDMLAKKTGRDFDKAYMDMMVDDHKTDINEFKKTSMESRDATLKNFATATLPTLQKHLDSAMAITGKY